MKQQVHEIDNENRSKLIEILLEKMMIKKLSKQLNCHGNVINLKLRSLIMNRMWNNIILPIIEKINAKYIIEIGSDTGINTKNILEYCVRNNGKLVSIDPFPKFDINQYKEYYGDIFELYKEISLDRLSLLKNYDVVLIDGDHNWYTVYNELKLIESSFANEKFPLIFLHDVLWPYARRDLYYNPETIPKEFRNDYFKKGIIKNQKFLTDEGGLNQGLYNSIEETSDKNGVLTAIEDFISESNVDYTFIKVNIFYGLGILFPKDKEIENFINLTVENADLLNLAENELTRLSINNQNLAIEKIEMGKEVVKLSSDNSFLKDNFFIKSEINEKLAKLSSSVEIVNQKIDMHTRNLSSDIDNTRKHFIKLNNHTKIIHDYYNKRSLKNKISSYLYPLSIVFKNRLKIKKSFLDIKGYKAIKKTTLFDLAYYLDEYGDIKDSDMDPLIHYIFHGYKEGRIPSAEFNGNYYLKEYKDVAESGLNPLIHYTLFGKRELRVCNNKNRLRREFNKIKKSQKFDEDWYLREYPEVKKLEMNPILHYLEFGAHLGFNPNETFDTNWYFKTYVEPNKINPFFHYLNKGKKSGFLPKPLSKEECEDKLNEIFEYNENIINLYPFDENSPLVSIIILTRNGLDHLKVLFNNFKETIQYPNYEIIIVDNDSKDDTIPYLESLSEELNIKIIKNKVNESFSVANNKAAKISNGEYLLFLNNDIEPLNGWLNEMMQSILKSDDIGVVGSKLIFPCEGDQYLPYKTQHEGIKFQEINGFLKPNDGFIVPYNIKGESPISENIDDTEMGAVLGASFLIKKDLFFEFDGFDDSFFYNYEDIDLCFKLYQKGYKIIYNPRSMLFHYYKATRNNNEILSYKINNQVLLYDRWNDWLEKEIFKEKLNNELIIAKLPFKIGIIGNKKQFKENQKAGKELGWIISFLKRTYSIPKRIDLIISFLSTYNPRKVRYMRKSLFKIAFIIEDLDKWIENGHISDYDLIFTSKIEFKNVIEEKYFKNVILVDKNILKSIKFALTID